MIDLSMAQGCKYRTPTRNCFLRHGTNLVTWSLSTTVKLENDVLGQFQKYFFFFLKISPYCFVTVKSMDLNILRYVLRQILFFLSSVNGFCFMETLKFRQVQGGKMNTIEKYSLSSPPPNSWVTLPFWVLHQ